MLLLLRRMSIETTHPSRPTPSTRARRLLQSRWCVLFEWQIATQIGQTELRRHAESQRGNRHPPRVPASVLTQAGRLSTSRRCGRLLSFNQWWPAVNLIRHWSVNLVRHFDWTWCRSRSVLFQVNAGIPDWKAHPSSCRFTCDAQTVVIFFHSDRWWNIGAEVGWWYSRWFTSANSRWPSCHSTGCINSNGQQRCFFFFKWDIGVYRFWLYC